MFGVDSAEFLIIIIVAVVVIGPKDLPRALYKLGQVMGKARAMGRHFRTGLDAMVREAELEELQKQWDKENARIMAEHPSPEPVMTEKALVDGASDEKTDEVPWPKDGPPESFDMSPPETTDSSLVEAVKLSQTPPVEDASASQETDAPKGATA